MFQKCRILLLLLTLMTSLGALAELKLSVKGLSEELDNNVDAQLSVIDFNSLSDTPYSRQYIEKEIKQALRALGYYEPTFQYQSSQSGDELTITVNAGHPVLIEKVGINLSGEGKNDQDYLDLVNNQTPEIGSVLNHGVYDAFKKSLQNLALRNGYFDAHMTKSRLAVADKLYQSFWEIDFDTGKRYQFGSVTFKETSIRESFLRNLIPFEEGEPYSSDKVTLLNRRLSSTNWFSSVTVVPLFNRVQDEKTLPFYVIASSRKKNVFDTGIGFSTDNGIRGKLGWNKPWLNDRGHSFQVNTALSSPEQILTAVYKIPLERSPLEDYYTIQGGYKRIDNNDTDSDSYTFGVIKHWDSFEGWQRAIGLNVMFDNFTQGEDSYETFLLYPSISFSRIRNDGSLYAMWGDSQRYSIEAASADVFSDINFVRVQFQQVWIRSLLNKHRFIVRGNLGIIQADDFNRVPPSFRFFAGGDRSIRGYSYQSISPKDSTGNLAGASKLVTGSVEYQYNITGNWWSALFVDSGEAVNKLSNSDFHTGAGVGIRWASPIGPIKLDIASPIGKGSHSSVHFYIGLGAEL